MWIILRLLIGISVLILVEFYFIRRISQSLLCFFPDFVNTKFKIIKRIFLICSNLYPVILIVVFVYASITGVFITQPQNIFYDYLLVYPFWILFLLMIQTSLYFIVIDLITITFYPVYKRNKDKIFSFKSKLVLAIAVFFLVYAPIRIIYDYNSVSIRIIEYKKADFPAVLENFKIAFISDIQADRYTNEARLINYMNNVNSVNPDLILIAGDIITTGPDHIKTGAKTLGMLKSKYGTYTCIGDHDNWAYRDDYSKSIKEITSALKENKIEMFDNTKKIINVGSAQIEVTFITNTYVESVNEELLDSISSAPTGDLNIFLTHQPKPNLIESAHKNNYDLFLTGHTHGGQITFLFPFVHLSPTMFETEYIRGDFWFDNLSSSGDKASMLMVVTRGLGMSLAPIRYNSTPEVTLIVLKNK